MPIKSNGCKLSSYTDNYYTLLDYDFFTFLWKTYFTFASATNPCFSEGLPLLQSACQQTGYCHSKDNPWKLCSANFSTAFLAKLALALESETSLAYLSDPESVHPPNDNRTLIFGFVLFATDTTRSKKSWNKNCSYSIDIILLFIISKIALFPINIKYITVSFIGENVRWSQFKCYWI